MSSLSVCMIVKNEEKNIERCLNSVKDIADEIIVVDTGSNDKTLEIAKSFSKVKTYNFEWINDFASARNYSLSKASKKWVLFMDADEEIFKDDIYTLKKLLKNEKKEAISFRLINIIDNKETTNNYTVRLFKRKFEYKFEGKIHEQITPAIYEKSGPYCIKESNIRLYHYGYDPQYINLDSKIQRNLDILNSFDEDEKDGFYYYNLATEYYRSEDYMSAIKYYTLGEKTPSFNKTYMPNLAVSKGRSFVNLGYVDLAIENFEYYITVFPNYRDLYFFAGTCYWDCNKHDKAYEKMLKYKNIKPGDFPDFYFDRLYNIDELLEFYKNH